MANSMSGIPLEPSPVCCQAAVAVEASLQKESISHFLPGFNKRAAAATILCFYCANKNTRKLLNQVPDADPHTYTYIFICTYVYLCVYIHRYSKTFRRPCLRPCGSAVFICNRKQKQSTANFVDAFSLL